MSSPSGWVPDASVVVKALVEEPDSARALGVMRAPLVAPDLLGTECANALWRKQREGALTYAEAMIRLERLRSLPIRRLSSDDLLAGALARAIRHRHPVYDCVYLEASAVTGLPLVTDDRRLLRLADDGARVVLLPDLPPA